MELIAYIVVDNEEEIVDGEFNFRELKYRELFSSLDEASNYCRKYKNEKVLKIQFVHFCEILSMISDALNHSDSTTFTIKVIETYNSKFF